MTGFVMRTPGFGARIAFGILLVVAADRLLFDGAFGVSFALFGLCVGLASIALNRTDGRRAIPSGALLAAAIVPLVENVSLLSILVATVLLAGCVLTRTGPLAAVPSRLPGFFAAAPLRFAADFLAVRRAARRHPRRQGDLTQAIGWIVPFALASVFVALFGMANPIIGDWLALIDPLAWLERIGFWQILLWLLVFLLVWPFLRPRLRRRSIGPRGVAAAAASVPTEPVPLIGQRLFGPAAILRSLVIFNLLFACQTALDAAYLWGGIALPNGMTYAAYAHRGAYPLVATALLAAGFVLLALRPGSAASQNDAILRLVYVWTAQNVVLVASSMLRLDLYVGVYSLTYWRAAAFVWMALVAAGLLAIVARIALARSNRWLLGVNLAMLAATLYASCFVNFADLIAEYNVSHSGEVDGNGAALDAAYLASLGPAAIPALDAALRHLPPLQTADGLQLSERRASLVARQRAVMADWRAWTFRGMRLSRYLEATELAAMDQSAPEVSQPRRGEE